MWPSSNWLCLLTFTTLWTLICTAPALTSMEIDVAVDDPQKTGCAYNDKFYKEGETVLTKEPCLNCTCRKGALRCHLQVCPYMHDLYPPPSGCVLVERKSACCPKLHCPTAGPGEGRLLRKDPSSQIATWRVREDLRKRLVKQLTKNGTDKLGCIESGTLYAEGSAMMTSSTCQYCFCLKGKQTCVKPQCAKPVLEGCTPRFRDLACCPTHYDCAMSTNNVTSIAATKKKITSNSAGGAVSSSTTGIRENDRIIDSPHTTTLQQQIPLKKLSRRKREDVKAKIEPPPLEEVMSSTTLGPDSLIDESQSSVTETTIPSATASTPASTPASTDEKTTTTKSEMPHAVAVDTSSDDQEPIVLLTNDVTAQKQKEDGKGQVDEENKEAEEKKEQEPKKQNLIPVAAIPEETPIISEESKVIPETVDDSKSKPIPEGIEADESQIIQEKDKPITEEIIPDTSKIIPEKNSQVIVEDMKSIPEESKIPVEIATMTPDVESGVPVVLSDEGSSTSTPSVTDDDPSINSSWIPVDEEGLPSSSRLDEPVGLREEGPEPIVADAEVPESDLEEKPIEFTVSSSLPSVGQQSEVVDEKIPVPPVVLKEPSNKMKPPPPPPPFNLPSNNNKPTQGVAGTQSNFLPIDAKVAASFSPIVPVPTVNDEQLPSAEDPDYDADYDNMELPPSLPNLEIIPFVAADAVMGLPENLDDDERLNLGGLAEQRTPLSHISPTADQSSNTDFCFIDGSFYSHGEVIVVDDETTDPCTLCRCMLGQLVCHQTKCAPVPPGCRSVERPSFCCGQIVCGSSSLLTGQGAGDRGAGAPNNSTGFNDRLDEDEDTLIIESDSEERNGTEPETSSKPTVSFSSSTSTSVFRPVTFPPRTSSTARISAAPVSSTVSTPLASSTAGNRFTLRKTTTTERSAITFRSKLNKPAVNNLVGASALPTGGLKIDSCNIYGQMYRVGRIIDELSGPCVECKCTEIGVNCTNLRC